MAPQTIDEGSACAPAGRGRLPRRLLLLNAGLLGVLGAMSWMGEAEAFQARPRADGEYLMTAGELQAGSAPAVYIIDTANQEMVVVKWDERNRRTELLGYRDLNADSSNQNPNR